MKIIVNQLLPKKDDIPDPDSKSPALREQGDWRGKGILGI